MAVDKTKARKFAAEVRDEMKKTVLPRTAFGIAEALGEAVGYIEGLLEGDDILHLQHFVADHGTTNWTGMLGTRAVAIEVSIVDTSLEPDEPVNVEDLRPFFLELREAKE